MSALTEEEKNGNKEQREYTKHKTKRWLAEMCDGLETARTNFENTDEPLREMYFVVYERLKTFSLFVDEGIIIMLESDFSPTESCLDSLVPALVYLATTPGGSGSDGRHRIATRAPAWFATFTRWWCKFLMTIVARREAHKRLAGTNSTKFKNF